MSSKHTHICDVSSFPIPPVRCSRATYWCTSIWFAFFSIKLLPRALSSLNSITFGSFTDPNCTNTLWQGALSCCVGLISFLVTTSSGTLLATSYSSTKFSFDSYSSSTFGCHQKIGNDQSMMLCGRRFSFLLLSKLRNGWYYRFCVHQKSIGDIVLVANEYPYYVAQVLLSPLLLFHGWMPHIFTLSRISRQKTFPFDIVMDFYRSTMQRVLKSR